MNNNGDSALIPKSSDAGALTEQRNGRILFAMVGDALAMAKASSAAQRVPTVLITGYPKSWWPWLQQAILQSEWGDEINVRVADGADPIELSNMLTQNPVDLVILNFAKEAEREACESLLNKLVEQPSTPVVIRDIPTTGHQALTSPWGNVGSGIGQDLLGVVRRYVRPPSLLVAGSDAASHFRRWVQGPRIVMLDDIQGVHDMLDAVIHSWFPVADIRHFMNGESAYQELLREPPDLFTQDVMHGDPDGDEILRRLTEKDVKYPIFVMSAWARKKEQLRPGCLGPNLNVTFFPKPFALDELYWILLKFVGLSGTTGVHLMTP